MRPINYWITFTAFEDKYREVMAVRMVWHMDEMGATCEIPAFGISVDSSDGDWNVQTKAMRPLYDLVAKRFGNNVLRQGVQTQAMYSETRDMLIADVDGALFDREHYFVAEDRRKEMNPNMFWAISLVAEQHEAGALADEDSELLLGDNAKPQAVRKHGGRDAESDPAITTPPMRLDEHSGVGVFDIEHLDPAMSSVISPAKQVTDLESIHRRHIDDDFTLHDFDAPGRLGFGHPSFDRGLSSRLGFLLVNDIPGENTECAKESAANAGFPSGKIFKRINGNDLSGIFRHPRRRVVLIDNTRLADHVSADSTVFEHVELVGICVDRPHNDAALGARCNAARVDDNQQFSGSVSRFEQLDLFGVHDPPKALDKGFDSNAINANST